MSMARKEYMDLLSEIGATGGATDDMMKLLQRLRDDFDEREGMLRRDGEEADRTPPATLQQEEHIAADSRRDNAEDGGLRRDPLTADTVSRSEYDSLKRKYVERFFTSPSEAMHTQQEAMAEDDEPHIKTIDELFKKREG